MQSDWTVACTAEDPEIVVPWAGKDPSLRYVDLRSAPDSIQEIPEAAEYSCVAAALRRWNQSNISLFTAKCDVWSYPAKLFDAEDLAEFAYARGSYIDLVPLDAATFVDFAACERQLRAWTDIARGIDLAACRSEWTLRPARIFPSLAALTANDTCLGGFATTLYVWGYGDSPEAAALAWDGALRGLIEPVAAVSPS